MEEGSDSKLPRGVEKKTKHQNDSTCPNVSLRVGTKVVRANKKVLEAESKYFQGLFNYRQTFEADTDEIDLTEDVDSMEDLKQMVKFLHSRVITISTKNVRRLVKMSTFFGISMLEQLCVYFIVEDLNMENVFSYYFCACQYGLSDIERGFRGFVETRFHDLLIYEESMTHLSCAQLLFTVHNNLLRYCSKESIFDFLLKWLEKKQKITQKHVNVVTEVIQYFNNLESFHNPPFEGRFSRNIIRLEEILGRHSDLSPSCAQVLRDNLVEFQRKLPSRTNVRSATKLSSQSSKCKKESVQITNDPELLHTRSCRANQATILHKTRFQPERNAKLFDNSNKRALKKGNSYDQLVADEKQSDKVKFHSGESEIKDECGIQLREKSSKCEALFTYSLRNRSEVDAINLEFYPDVEDRVYDLCVYDAVSRTWYHIASFDEDTYLDMVNKKSDMDEFIDDLCLMEVTEVQCNITFFGNEILLQDRSDKYILMKYNIAKEDWKRIDIFGKMPDFVSNENFYDFKLATGKNGLLYMIVCYVVILCEVDSNGVLGFGQNNVRFDGFLVNPKSFSLRHIFKTDVLPYAPYNSFDRFQAYNSVEVEYSPSSNELLMGYSSALGLHLAYVINLDNLDNSKMSGLLQPKLLFHDVKEVNAKAAFSRTHILNLDDRFLVAESLRLFGTVTVKFEYMYNSKILKPVDNGPEYTAGEHWRSFVNVLGSPLWYYTPHQGNSFWMLEGKGDLTGCYLKRVTLNTSGEPSVEYHTPPPFNVPGSAYATKVNKKFFSKLKPVKHFLKNKMF